jgi:hypothetical protein
MSEQEIREELRKAVDDLMAARALRIKLLKKLRQLGRQHPDFQETKAFADEALETLTTLQERRTLIAHQLRKSRSSPDFVEQARQEKIPRACGARD